MASNSQSLPGAEQMDELEVNVVGVDEGNHRLEWFLGKVAKEVGKMLADNARRQRSPDNSVEEPMDVFDGVLTPDNVREVKVRDKPLEDARVTFWLKECPLWASYADTRKLIHTTERGDCHVVIDVRQY